MVSRGRSGPDSPSSRTLPGVCARRATARAVKFAMDPPETRMPSAVGGNPSISASHRDDAAFDVRRGVIAAPAVRVHAGSQEVREDADGIRRRVDEAVEARMGVAHRIGHDVLAHEREDLLEGLALFGQRLVEEGGPVADLPEDGPRIEALAMRGDRVRRERLPDDAARRGEGRTWVSSCRGLNHGPERRDGLRRPARPRMRRLGSLHHAATEAPARIARRAATSDHRLSRGTRPPCRRPSSGRA